jgi:glycosyltransferase involved in cell wall biosynthesis
MKGGVGRYTYNLAHALKKKNKTDVFISTNIYPPVTTTTTSSPYIIDTTTSSTTTNNSHICNDIEKNNGIYRGYIKKGDRKNSDRLLKLVEQLKPDIVNIQYERGLYEIDTTVSHIIKRAVYGSTLDKFYKNCPVPTVSTLHTIIPPEEYQQYIKERAFRKEGRFASLPSPIRAAIRRWVLERRYDLLLEVARLSYDIISPAITIHEIVKRGTVIYHGAEPAISTQLPSPTNKQDFRKEFGLPSDKRLLLSFGYVGSYKGFDILDSLKLPQEWSLIVKQNRHERGIEQPLYIKKAVNLHLDYLQDETLSKLFFACDAIIFPYKVVSVSGVLFDALAHGLPFVATELRFFKEFAEMGLGITCRRNAVSFSESIATLSADYDRYKINVQQFKPKLRWNHIADKHIEFYSKLLNDL